MTEPAITDLLRPDGDGAILPGIDPRSTPGVADRETAEAELAALADRLDELQERLWVEGSRSLLVVLQGMDTSGKGGTVRHVFSSMNPAGVEVASFKKPTEEELAHHFLWRIERKLPVPGEVTVFDRSHYEDVLVVRVRSLVPEDVWRARYEEIVAFEERVAAAGTTIVKCMLHISYEEQRERLLARLDDPVEALEVPRGRHRGAHAVAGLPGGLRGGDPGVLDRDRAVVRDPRRPQVVPQLGDLEAAGRDAGGDGSAAPPARPRRRGPEGAGCSLRTDSNRCTAARRHPSARVDP